MSSKISKFRKPKKIRLKEGEEAPTMTMPDLYTLNKQMMLNEPIMEPGELNDKKSDLYNYIAVYQDYALLCRERYDFTAFRVRNSSITAVNELMECLMNRGSIISIDKEEDNTWEIWLKIDDEAFMYKFFHCDWIIDC